MKLYRVSWVIDGKSIGGLYEVDAVSVSYAAAKVKVMMAEEHGVDISQVRISGVSTVKVSQS